MFTMREQLPKYKSVRFRNAPLELCLAQVRFPSLIAFAQPNVRDAFRRDLREEYPLFAAEQAMGLAVTPQGVNSIPVGEQLRFTSIDNNWAVTLTNESISLETRKYTTIEEFIARLHAVLERLAAHYDPTYRTRFGVRYINEIRIHPQGESFEGWRHMLNPDLLGLSGREIIGGAIEQTISEIRTRRDDGSLLFRHGFLNGTTVAPNGRTVPKTGPFYLLDFDYYDERPEPFNSDVSSLVMAYHDVIYRLFMWCISDGEETLLTTLGGEG